MKFALWHLKKLCGIKVQNNKMFGFFLWLKGQQATKGSEEQQASNWSWEMIFRLKLHSSYKPQEAGTVLYFI